MTFSRSTLHAFLKAVRHSTLRLQPPLVLCWIIVPRRSHALEWEVGRVRTHCPTIVLRVQGQPQHRHWYLHPPSSMRFRHGESSRSHGQIAVGVAAQTLVQDLHSLCRRCRSHASRYKTLPRRDQIPPQDRPPQLAHQPPRRSNDRLQIITAPRPPLTDLQPLHRRRAPRPRKFRHHKPQRRDRDLWTSC